MLNNLKTMPEKDELEINMSKTKYITSKNTDKKTLQIAQQEYKHIYLWSSGNNY